MHYMYKISLIILLLGTALFVKAQDVSKFPITTKTKPAAKRILFYLSGDGGMNGFSQSLTQSLNDKNYAVVCLDSKKYFWEQKTPDKFAQDLSLIIEHFLKTWDKGEFSVIGYSFGADAALFAVPRFQKDLQAKLKSTVLLSPSTSTDFVIRISDMMGFGSKDAKYKTLPEVSKFTSELLFIFGKDEASDLYKAIPDRKNIAKVQIPGSHKFDSDIPKVVSTIQNGL